MIWAIIDSSVNSDIGAVMMCLTFLPADEPERSAAARDLARALAGLVETGKRRAVLVGRVDGTDPRESPLGPYLAEAGFFAGSRGYLKRALPRPGASAVAPHA